MRLLYSILSYIQADYGNIASVASLVLSIAIYLKVRRIQSAYLFAARVPKLNERLSQHASRLIDLRGEYPASRSDIAEELAMSRATLQSLHNKLPRRQKKSASVLVRRISRFETATDGKAEVHKIYVELRELYEEVKNFQEDLEWIKE